MARSGSRRRAAASRWRSTRRSRWPTSRRSIARQSTGFGNVTIEAVPGFAYVFRIVRADGVHFAGVRVAFRTADYVVFDWSYQTAPGNAELNRSPRA